MKLLTHLFSIGIIVLEFDGSLRPPRDPGYPKLPTKMASCAAAISCNDKPLALGGKVLPVYPDTTSTDTEYEGLLLGLNWLLETTTIQDDKSLLVRGDCKAILDQLAGRSTPRRRSDVYCANAQAILSQFPNVQYQHIPRSQNQLCDSLCSRVMTLMEETAYCRALQEADDASVLFGPKSLIRYSRRPKLFQIVISKALQTQDYSRLLELAQLLQEHGRWTQSKRLLAHGIYYQIQSYTAMGNLPKQKALERKHKYILKHYRDCLVAEVIQDDLEMNCEEQIDSVYRNPCIESWLRHVDVEQVQIKGFWDTPCRPGGEKT